MRIEVFVDFSSELEKIWRECEADAAGYPFQSYIWLSHWQNTVGLPLHSILPQLIVVWNEKEVQAIIPLSIRRLMGVNVLEWLGGEHTDYMGPLLSKKWKNIDKEFPLCWQNIVSKLVSFDVIHFQKQMEYIGPLLNPFVMSMSCYSNLSANHTNLKNSWKEHYEKTVKIKLRADSRRQRSRLAEFGELKFEVAKDNITKKKIIEKMVIQKSRRYCDTGVWDMLSVPENKVFYEKLVEITDDYIKIHCAALIVGDVFVATHVGFVDKSTFYYLMPAHEGGDWERYSPGRLLLEHLIEWAIQDDLKVFDFTVGGENYKKDWCDTETPLFEILEAVTFKGKIYVIAQNTKQTLKQMPWLGEKARQFNVWKKNRK